MNKQQRLIKKLIKVGIFSAIVLVVLGGGYIFIGEYQDSLVTSEERLSAEKSKLKRKHDELLARHERAKVSLDLYQQLVNNNAQDSFSIEKRLITNLLKDFNTEFQLRDLQLEVAPPEQKKGDVFTMKTGQLLTSEVEISFQSITDSFAYAFFDRVIQGVSRFLVVREMRINANKQVDPQLLQEARENTIPTLASAALVFEWVGLRTEDETN
jgi:hypothetical protein